MIPDDPNDPLARFREAIIRGLGPWAPDGALTLACERAPTSAVITPEEPAGSGGAAAATAGSLGKNADFVAAPLSQALAQKTFRPVASSRALAFTLPQAAHKLGISHVALAREIRAGRFPKPIKVGSLNRITLAQIDEFRAQFGGPERIAPYKRNRPKLHRARRLNYEMVRLHSELLFERRTGRRA